MIPALKRGTTEHTEAWESLSFRISRDIQWAVWNMLTNPFQINKICPRQSQDSEQAMLQACGVDGHRPPWLASTVPHLNLILGSHYKPFHTNEQLHVMYLLGKAQSILPRLFMFIINTSEQKLQWSAAGPLTVHSLTVHLPFCSIHTFWHLKLPCLISLT